MTGSMTAVGVGSSFCASARETHTRPASAPSRPTARDHLGSSGLRTSQATDVTYGDPNLVVTPSTGSMRVYGTVVDIAESEYGFKVLLVYADRIDLQ